MHIYISISIYIREKKETGCYVTLPQPLDLDLVQGLALIEAHPLESYRSPFSNTIIILSLALKNGMVLHLKTTCIPQSQCYGTCFIQPILLVHAKLRNEAGESFGFVSSSPLLLLSSLACLRVAGLVRREEGMGICS